MEAYAFAGIREEQRRAPAVLRRRAAGRGGFTLTAAAAPAKGKAAVKAAGKGAAAAVVKPDVGAVNKKASASAFRGGVAGFAAGVVQARARTGVSIAFRAGAPNARPARGATQVGTFMWMRTVMNYQARPLARARRAAVGRPPPRTVASANPVRRPAACPLPLSPRARAESRPRLRRTST